MQEIIFTNWQGFRATWKKVSTVGGSIKSPNFPQHYPPESNEVSNLNFIKIIKLANTFIFQSYTLTEDETVLSHLCSMNPKSNEDFFYRNIKKKLNKF